MRFQIFWKKKYEPHRTRNSEVIDSEKFLDLNASQGFVVKTLWQWTCELVTKTPEICRKELLCYFLIILIKINEKKLVSIRSEILRLLDNRFTGNYEYSRSNREKLALPIQIKLSKKPLLFCDIPLIFLESTGNFECSEKIIWAS